MLWSTRTFKPSRFAFAIAPPRAGTDVEDLGVRREKAPREKAPHPPGQNRPADGGHVKPLQDAPDNRVHRLQERHLADFDVRTRGDAPLLEPGGKIPAAETRSQPDEPPPRIPGNPADDQAYLHAQIRQPLRGLHQMQPPVAQCHNDFHFISFNYSYPIAFNFCEICFRNSRNSFVPSPSPNKASVLILAAISPSKNC